MERTFLTERGSGPDRRESRPAPRIQGTLCGSAFTSILEWRKEEISNPAAPAYWRQRGLGSFSFIMHQSVRESLDAVARWVEGHEYRAYDPGDGDMSFLRHLTFNVDFLRRLLTASVLRTPFHIRPWIGIRPHRSTKGTGYMGWGYVKMYSLTRDETYRRLAESCFEWLIENRAPDWEQYCWGNDFAFSTRAGTIPKGTPTIVWSSLIALAFLEAYDALENPKYLEVARSTGEWVKR